MVASISFFLAVWLMVYLATKKLVMSLGILGVLGIWYGLVYLLAQMGFWAQNPLFLPFIVFGFIIGAWMGGTTVYIYTEDGKKTEVKWDDDQEKDLPTIIREGFDKGARSPLTGHHSDNPPQ